MKKTSIEHPVYTRDKKSFFQQFQVQPSSVITEMDKQGDDIPYQTPTFPLEINHAGLTRENVPIRILDPLRGKKRVQVNADILLQTKVPALRRGLHISRIGNLIANITNKVYKNLQECSADIAQAFSDSQYGEATSVDISAPFSYIENIKGWKKEKTKKSLETIILTATTDINKHGISQSAGMEISNQTACPCVQQTYKHALLLTGKKQKAIDEISPLLTHSQRCNTKISISSIPEQLDILSLLKIVDETLVRVQNTLPREEELIMVYRAHNKPQFMEDVVRDTIANVYNCFKNTYPGSSIEVFTKSFESIHNFDIQARAEYKFTELATLLQK